MSLAGKMSRENDRIAGYRVAVVFADYFYPASRAGGTVTSLMRLLPAQDNWKSFVITRARDHGSRILLEVELNRWTDQSIAKVLYVRSIFFGLRTLLSNADANKPAIYFLGSVHSLPFSIVPALLLRLGLLPSAPVLVAPNGEFGRVALNHHRLRKIIGRYFLRSLYSRGVTWRASSAAEKNEILRWLGNNRGSSRHDHNIVVVPDMPPLPSLESGDPDSGSLECQKGGSLRVVFLARIQPSKGLHRAISLLSGLGFPVQFKIFGPIEEPQYFSECLALIDGLGRKFDWEYAGVYETAELPRIFAEADAMVLLTDGEGFGHSIAEALSFGCPVISTTSSPWLEFMGPDVGCFSDNPVDWERYLHSLYEMSQLDRLSNRKAVASRYLGWAQRAAAEASVLFDLVTATNLRRAEMESDSWKF